MDPARLTTSSDSAPPVASAHALRFTDDLLRPFVIGTVSLITLVQLIMRPPTALPELTWTLVALTIAASIASLFPWTRLPGSAQVGLAVGFIALAALLFPLSRDTAAPAFAFVASSVAGEKLTSRTTAFTVAATGAAISLLATLALQTLSLVPTQSEWWLALAVWLPVYIGTSRRDRANALSAAELAAAESERAATSEARAAALDERSRIAREIHDVLGHSLSSIAMQLDMADALHLAGQDDAANQAVLRARTFATAGMGETRRAIQALREGILPLAETLAQLADSTGASFRVRGEPAAIPVEASQALIRTAQEAITNASRYAPGARVEVVLEIQDRIVKLSVIDSGAAAGTRRTDVSGSGMGLVGMRERASLLGGSLRAGPSDPPSTGWTVEMELPR
jgi:signal transduction histidine kinase